MKKEDYIRECNRIRFDRYASTIQKNHAETKICRQTISSVSTVCGTCPIGIHEGPFSIEISIFGKCRADIDNVAKGILDALNGVAYSDDRQCVELIVRREGKDNV